MSYIVLNDHWIMIAAAFLTAFLISYLAIPSLVKVAKAKDLYDKPNGRTSHYHITPTLGGVAIFAGFVISSMIFVDIAHITNIQYILAGAIIIFFLGLKDDIIGLSPLKKFIGEIIAAFIIIDFGHIHITNLHGLFGIYNIDQFGGDFLTMIIILGIINAMNLIDGIDGLASGVGILASLTFGAWFYLVGDRELTILAVALVGGLLAFFRFNFFPGPNKIFMGDIGSLLLGYILAIFAIMFNERALTIAMGNPYFIQSAPAVSIGILIVPVFDTVRVMVVRMIKGKSPFKADKRHVHHYLFELTGSHRKSTAIILFVNLIFIFASFYFAHMGVTRLIIYLLVLAAFVSSIPYYFLHRKRKSEVVAEGEFKADA